jgi:DNA-binding beta-propeller fold protein YncE
MTKKNRLAGIVLIVFALAAGMSPRIFRASAARSDSGPKVPVFEIDRTWPQLPNNWVLGNVSKVVVDQHDNVWFIHRPRNPALKVPEGKAAAPPVLEFDANGRFVQAWGGPGNGYDWPDTEHNIFVDHRDNIWISGSSPNNSKTRESDDMILKFSNKGKFLLQIGGRSASNGNKDTKNVNKPGDLFVSPKTNEVYAADGYGNRRVIVFDGDSGAFKRMWGAFGKPVEDVPGSGGRGAGGGPAIVPGAPAAEGGTPAGTRALDTDGPGAPNYSLVHSVIISNDNIVYIGDRPNRRIQLFTPEGKYLTQMFVNRAGPSASSVSGLAFSPDKEQQFLYIADYGNSHIVVANRKKLEVLYQFGKRGATPGDFQGIHHLAVDSKGNLYAAEVAPGARIQRFVYKGLSSTMPANALTAEQLAAKPQ